MQALTTLTQRIALLNRHDVHAAAQSPPGNEKEAVVSWLTYGGREARNYLMQRDSLTLNRGRISLNQDRIKLYVRFSELDIER
jgi:hypothetical protein